MRSIALLVVLSIMSVLGCGGKESTGPGTGGDQQSPSVASVAVTPSTTTLVSLEETVQLTASARDASGNAISGKTFTWSSSDANVATVSASGLVTAVTNGSATVTATTDGVNGTAAIEVDQAVTAVAVDPATEALFALDETVQLTATATDALGSPVIAPAFTWASSDPMVATVDANGLVTSVAAGMITITSTSQGVSGTAQITVNPWIAVSAGFGRTCGVTTNGAAYCWGSGVSTVPGLVAGGLTFASVDAGSRYSCGVTTSGAAYCWGDNSWGQLGDGSFTNSSVPVVVSGGLTFSSVATMVPVGVNGAHTCGVTTSGAAYCWGLAQYGQLGVGAIFGLETCNTFSGPSFCSSVPVPVSGGLTFVSVSTGSRYSCGVTLSGDGYCWGIDIGGGLPNSNVPRLVPGGPTFASVASKMQHTCAGTSSGAGYCWGAGVFGKLGDGSTSSSLVPVLVAGGLSFASVGAGVQHTCGVTTSDVAYCWGGILDGSTVPTPVPGGLTFVTVSAGGHSCGVTPSGAVYCWGSGFSDTELVRVADPEQQ